MKDLCQRARYSPGMRHPLFCLYRVHFADAFIGGGGDDREGQLVKVALLNRRRLPMLRIPVERRQQHHKGLMHHSFTFAQSKFTFSF
jgi:hypothetical protein